MTKDEQVECYLIMGLYDDGLPAEMFLKLAKAGESLRGLARCWSTCFSVCLQMGVPLEQLVEKFKFWRFEPAGWTDNPAIPSALSVADYVARWLELTFLKTGDDEGRSALGWQTDKGVSRMIPIVDPTM